MDATRSVKDPSLRPRPPPTSYDDRPSAIATHRLLVLEVAMSAVVPRYCIFALAAAVVSSACDTNQPSLTSVPAGRGGGAAPAGLGAGGAGEGGRPPATTAGVRC